MGCAASVNPAKVVPSQETAPSCQYCQEAFATEQERRDHEKFRCECRPSPTASEIATVIASREVEAFAAGNASERLASSLRGLGVQDVAVAAAAMRGAGIHSRADFMVLDADLKKELDEELKKGGVSIGDRAKIRKAQEAGVPVKQGNGQVEVLALGVGEAVQADRKLERVFLGLGWNEESATGKVDVDASCVAFARDGSVHEEVYFMNLKNNSRSVCHTGDVLHGSAHQLADSERIYVWLSQVPAAVCCLTLVANVYTAGADFAQLREAYIRLVNADTNQELSRLRLAGGGLKGNAVVFAKLYRVSNGPWQLQALGMPLHVPGCTSLDKMVPLLQSNGSALLPPLEPSEAAKQDDDAKQKRGRSPIAVYACPALAVATAAGIAAATAIFMSDSLNQDMLSPSLFEAGVNFAELVPNGDILAGVDGLMPTEAIGDAYEWAGSVTEGVDMGSSAEVLGQAVGAVRESLGAAGEAVGGVVGDAVVGAPEALGVVGEGLGSAGGAVGGLAGDTVAGAPAEFEGVVAGAGSMAGEATGIFQAMAELGGGAMNGAAGLIG